MLAICSSETKGECLLYVWLVPANNIDYNNEIITWHIYDSNATPTMLTIYNLTAKLAGWHTNWGWKTKNVKRVDAAVKFIQSNATELKLRLLVYLFLMKPRTEWNNLEDFAKSTDWETSCNVDWIHRRGGMTQYDNDHVCAHTV